MQAYVYTSVDLPSLPPDKRHLYTPLIYPNIYDLFDPLLSRSGQVITIGAYLKDQPVGLISAFAYTAAREALLASFYVDPAHRLKGIGTQLMVQLLEKLHNLSVSLAQAQYEGWESTVLSLETLLAKTGWNPPKPLLRQYYLDQFSFHPPWYFSPFPSLPLTCQIFPWEEASAADLKEAKEWVSKMPPLTQYSPFNSDLPFERLNSLGIRHKGNLAGWLITHRVEPRVIRYSAFYLSSILRGTGAAIYLLKESIRRHLQAEIATKGMMEINIQNSPPSWLRFIETRLASSAFLIQEIRSTYRVL